MSAPAVVTVILNWNNAQRSIESARSVMCASAYAYAAGEVSDATLVIVDNGSDAGDLQMLRSWHRRQSGRGVRLVVNPENLGYAAGMNAGIREALTEATSYVWLLNNDTEVAVDALSAMLRFSAQHPSAMIIGSTIIDPQKQVTWSAGGYRYLRWFGYGKALGPGLAPSEVHAVPEPRPDYVDGAAIWLRGEFLRRTGGVPEKHFLYFEELELNRYLAAGETVGWCRNALVTHEGAASVSTTLGARRATYHAALSAFEYTARVHPWCLPTVVLSRIFGIAVRSARTLQPGLLCAVFRAGWVLVVKAGRDSPEIETGSMADAVSAARHCHQPGIKDQL